MRTHERAWLGSGRRARRYRGYLGVHVAAGSASHLVLEFVATDFQEPVLGPCRASRAPRTTLLYCRHLLSPLLDCAVKIPP